MIHIFKNYVVIALSLALSACGEENVHKFVAEVKQTSKGQVNELPPEKEPLSEEYTANDYRSPFVSGPNLESSGLLGDSSKAAPAKPHIDQKPRPDLNRPREYLEFFPMNNFVMVGTMSKKEFIWGLVLDKLGMVHAVKVGNYIGENSGIITSINDDKINITETIPDGAGGWKKSNTELDLKNAAAEPTPKYKAATVTKSTTPKAKASSATTTQSSTPRTTTTRTTTPKSTGSSNSNSSTPSTNSTRGR